MSLIVVFMELTSRSYTVHIKFSTDTTRAHHLEVLLYRNLSKVNQVSDYFHLCQSIVKILYIKNIG